MKYRYPFLAVAIGVGAVAFWAGVPAYWAILLVTCPIMMLLMMSWSMRDGGAR